MRPVLGPRRTRRHRRHRTHAKPSRIRWQNWASSVFRHRFARRPLQLLHKIRGAGEGSPVSGLRQRQAGSSGQQGSRRWMTHIPFRHSLSLRRTTTGSERCRRSSRDHVDSGPVSTACDPTRLGCSRSFAVIEALRVAAGRIAALLAGSAPACPRVPWRHDGWCQSPSATPSLRALARRARKLGRAMRMTAIARSSQCHGPFPNERDSVIELHRARKVVFHHRAENESDQQRSERIVREFQRGREKPRSQPE